MWAKNIAPALNTKLSKFFSKEKVFVSMFSPPFSWGMSTCLKTFLINWCALQQKSEKNQDPASAKWWKKTIPNSLMKSLIGIAMQPNLTCSKGPVCSKIRDSNKNAEKVAWSYHSTCHVPHQIQKEQRGKIARVLTCWVFPCVKVWSNAKCEEVHCKAISCKFFWTKAIEWSLRFYETLKYLRKWFLNKIQRRTEKKLKTEAHIKVFPYISIFST